MAETQISAYISEATKQQIERYAEAHGVKKGHLVEEAVLHHLQALRELPADIVIPPRLVVTRASFERVAELARKPRKPTKGLRDLMSGKPVGGEP
jgi:alcohol dehydrogenase class IV